MTMLGEANGRAVLTRDQVRRIYKLVWEGCFSHRQLARKFGTSPTNVHAIKHRKSWGWLWSDGETQP
jgi:uncharacterized protein YjcR